MVSRLLQKNLVSLGLPVYTIRPKFTLQVDRYCMPWVDGCEVVIVAILELLQVEKESVKSEMHVPN